MSRRVIIRLTAEQRSELLDVRQHHEKAYMRERAAAILQIADGKQVGAVAAHGLARPRRAETVSAWVHRYGAEGVAGLAIQPGRGRVRGKRLLGVRREPSEGT